MAYKSDADHYRELFERQQRETAKGMVIITDLREWNAKLAEETLRIRESNRELRLTNSFLELAMLDVALLTILVIAWCIAT